MWDSFDSKPFFMECCGKGGPGCVPLGKVVSAGGMWDRELTLQGLSLALSCTSWGKPNKSLTTPNPIFWSVTWKLNMPQITMKYFYTISCSTNPSNQDSQILCISILPHIATDNILTFLNPEISRRRFVDMKYWGGRKETEHINRLACPGNGRPVVRGL